MKDEVPIRWALLWIVLSTVLVSGTAFTGWWGYHYWKRERTTNDTFLIRNISHTGELPTDYLAELLELSTDRTENLYAFDRTRGVALLRASPLISDAHIAVQKPDTLLIHYSLRQPVAILRDWTHTALDQEGVAFPYTGGEDLPRVYLGKSTPKEALKLLYLSDQLPSKVIELDLSRADHPYYGKREVVVFLEDRLDFGVVEEIYPRYLRLDPYEVEDGLRRFGKLRDHLLQEEHHRIALAAENASVVYPATIVDLRLENLAYYERLHSDSVDVREP